jgi:hypothetical protein
LIYGERSRTMVKEIARTYMGDVFVPSPLGDCVIIRFFVAAHLGEIGMLNINSLRPYGRLQSQNMIMTHPLWKRGVRGDSIEPELIRLY